MRLATIAIRYCSSTSKTRLLSTKTLPSSYFNHISKIISENKPLTEQDKPIFKDYWEHASNQFPNSTTILQDTELQNFNRFIKNNKKNSSTIRGFYRREILLNKENLPLLQSIASNLEDPLAFCIKDSLSTKDVAIAADLFILYYRLYPNEPLNHDLASDIISAMSFQNPRHDQLHLTKFLLLIRLFKKHNEQLQLTTGQASNISNKALSMKGSPALTKHILMEVMYNSNNSNMTSRSESITTAYHIIETDFKSRNAAGVFFAWKKIENRYESLADHDPRILYMVLKICMNNKIYKHVCKDIISRLPPEYYSNNSLILPTIITYIVRAGNLQQAQELMDNVNNNILPENVRNVFQTRSCLSSLLKMHLKFNDSQGVDRVLKQIHEVFGEHSQEDFQAIVAHILKNKTSDNIVKAVNLVSKIPETKALLAYGTIINTIVDWQIASNGRFDKKSTHIINDLLTKAHQVDPKQKSTLWSILASLYIKRLVHYKNFKKSYDSERETLNLDLAKLIFLKSCSNSGQTCTINPFVHSSPQNIVLKITNKNKIILLRNIALGAIKGCRKDIFLWCCTELFHGGVPIKELILDWHAMFDHRFRSIESLEDIKLKDKLSIADFPLIKNALKQ
ncbi:hypothetical protein ZYGR_0I07710 [Zygosaccharomyces rouxii]|uniref:Cytochrome B pre-mRNA-processing protein 1 n=1 Tax=Zygosaccharomyces rouxii TaxID=4956 RepID=A0A1Q2ZYG8_ZYGRO|nr:hypothetical protein ZYGR_0I07710 [Zygosaccharomyces rouxii]